MLRIITIIIIIIIIIIYVMRKSIFIFLSRMGNVADKKLTENVNNPLENALLRTCLFQL
jgi:hypothetical protein